MTRSGVERHNAATRRLYDHKRNKDLRAFRGVDGEGGNVEEEGTLFGLRHQYLSLRSGADLLETGKPLNWEECLAFLTDQEGQRIDVSYFFDYDVTMMIRTMPKEKAFRLLNRHLRVSKGGAIMPVDIGDYQVDYLPHKEFKVRRRGQRGWTIVSDVGQFFQSSFLSTLHKWDIGTPEEREQIAKGKAMRADFTESNAEIRAYNALECLLLEDLMEQFREVCSEVGYVPKKWQGPGYLASAMLDRHKVPKRDDVPILANRNFRSLAQAAYYGGRFETTCCGPVPGPVWQYDINSAYPHILRSLPCLLHGSWKKIQQRPSGDALYFAQVRYSHEGGTYLYHLPARLKSGHIQFPREGIGVYWSTELEAAERAGTQFQFIDGWLYEPHCQCRWFDFIDHVYAQRKRMGKSAKGMVLKLALNSLYGKIAQSIGYAPWANPVWAGLITAGCRAMLIDAYSQAPDKCYMLATDGIFMGCPLDLPCGDQLGEWEETVHPDGMFVVQPGIYFISEDAKTRGVERGRIQDMRPIFQAQFDKFMASGGVDHTVSVPVDNFITARQAIQRNKWHIAGTWERTTRELSFDWSSKRKRGVAFFRDGILRTVPHDGGKERESIPYKRIIGGEETGVAPEERYADPGLAEAARMSEQPDWNQPML